MDIGVVICKSQIYVSDVQDSSESTKKMEAESFAAFAYQTARAVSILIQVT